MEDRLLLRANADLASLAPIRRFVEAAARNLGVDPTAVRPMLLAVDEACTNIVLHGYGDVPGMIEVEVSREREALVVRLRDDAAPFDPTVVTPPDTDGPIEEREPGGLGIAMMRQATDAMHHRVTPQGGNELTLVGKGSGTARPDEEPLKPLARPLPHGERDD